MGERYSDLMERLMEEGERSNAVRIAKEMYARGEKDEEIIDTLSKTFEASMTELREILELAKRGS